ncbi:hypothetical protein CA54_39020 [Symmachiella macrocystis]|uniref:Uncharacterized protein n=1 Tax=Symmachiella macrocystis TaxID=2527985 RepID=A0A5C6BBM9_9PLAN|nr:hypothetical protein [Symmachiella macrocystis]TWU08666.1 hypothetical protein CA54_39020 [Symmachiella macrocystis]
MRSQYSPLLFFIYPAIAMLLGWGLRGTIGGGPIGALIPGAMVSLVLCQLLNRRNSVGFIICLGALGIGIGGHQTYGQTIGLSRFGETYLWGSFAMAVKGAVWGFLGGAVLGLAFVRDRFTTKQILFAMTAMVAATFVGWAYLDAPRHPYFYFSDPDKPRAEIWAGLLLGGLALLASLAVSSDNKVPASFAMWGLLFGGLGFGLGGQLIAFGSRLDPPYRSFSWWKGMEFSFGFLLGGGLGLAAYFNRDQLAEPATPTPELVPKQTPFLPALFLGAILVLTVHRLHFTVPVLFIMVIELAVLTGLVLNSNFFGWHIAVTLTVYSFGLDLMRAIGRLLRDGKVVYFNDNIGTWWVVVALMSLGTAIAVTANYRSKQPSIKAMLLLITWTGTAVGLMKMYQLSQQDHDVNYYFVCGTFLVSAILTTLIAWIIPETRPIDAAETT